MPDYPQEKIFDKLKKNREVAVKVLKKLSAEDRNKINIPKKWTKHKDEKWTAGKMLRRFLEHEREHIGTIERVLSLYKRASRRGGVPRTFS